MMMRISPPICRRPYQGLGQYSGKTRELDSTINTALDVGAGILRATDPKIDQSVAYVKRIIGAPPLFASKAQAAPGAKAKISDLNSYLKIGAVVRENPVYVGLAALAIPLAAFFAGRALGSRSRAAKSTSLLNEPAHQGAL